MNNRRQFDRWLAGRPAVIRALARTLKPWFLYRMRATGQIVQLRSLSEDGTVTVVVLTGLIPGFGVFGVRPRDLQRLTPRELLAEGFTW